MVVQAGEREFWVVDDIRIYQRVDGSVWLKFDGREMRMVPRQLNELGLEISQFHWENLCRAYGLPCGDGSTPGEE